MNFANRYIGGATLDSGRVQEEIRFCICPELIISMLIMGPMDSNEAVIVTVSGRGGEREEGGGEEGGKREKGGESREEEEEGGGEEGKREEVQRGGRGRGRCIHGDNGTRWISTTCYCHCELKERGRKQGRGREEGREEEEVGKGTGERIWRRVGEK